MQKFKLIHAIVFALSALPVIAVAQGAPRPPGITSYDPSWVPVSGKDCWLRVYNAVGGETAQWTGACQDGFGTGPGTATVLSPYGRTEVMFGTLTKGKFNGRMVVDQMMAGQHFHIEVDQAKDSWVSGQGTIVRDIAGKKIFEYTGQIFGISPRGQGHGITYDATGAVESDYTGEWKDGKPVANATSK
jgi:hypothetical protein